MTNAQPPPFCIHGPHELCIPAPARQHQFVLHLQQGQHQSVLDSQYGGAASTSGGTDVDTASGLVVQSVCVKLMGKGTRACAACAVRRPELQQAAQSRASRSLSRAALLG